MDVAGRGSHARSCRWGSCCHTHGCTSRFPSTPECPHTHPASAPLSGGLEKEIALRRSPTHGGPTDGEPSACHRSGVCHVRSGPLRVRPVRVANDLTINIYELLNLQTSSMHGTEETGVRRDRTHLEWCCGRRLFASRRLWAAREELAGAKVLVMGAHRLEASLRLLSVLMLSRHINRMTLELLKMREGRWSGQPASDAGSRPEWARPAAVRGCIPILRCLLHQRARAACRTSL